jgi:HAD superfamily hydrolase (TIGR01549 family)
VGVRAVVFDLDLTIWRPVGPPDFELLTRLQWAAVQPDFKRLGLARVEGIPFIESLWSNLAGWTGYDPNGPDMIEPRWLKGPWAIQQLMAEHAYQCNLTDAESIWASINNVPFQNLEIFPDAPQTLEQLLARGFRLAIATGRPRSAESLAGELRGKGMPDVFDVIVTSGELGYRKPHELVFQSVLERLRLRANEAVMIGDSYEDDVVPAAKLGMIPVLKLNERESNPEWKLARHQVRSLADLLDLALLQ